jgi:large subunit ribosomal protein L29
MKIEEIRDLSDRDLRQHLEDNRKELFNLRFQIETRKLKNHQRVREVKREMARMETILRERELMRIYSGEEVGPAETAVAARTEQAPRRRGLFGRFGGGNR